MRTETWLKKIEDSGAIIEKMPNKKHKEQIITNNEK